MADKTYCTGCLVCKKLCPKDAIEIAQDELGFSYAHIDGEKCIKCGKCEKICDSLVRNSNERENQKYYAAINKSSDIVKNSGSGGMFNAIAKYMLGNGATIYGATYDEGFHISHRRVDSIDDISTVMGTKYTQSKIFDVYDLVVDDLKNDREVLFVGTPCQCSAIRQYVSQETVSSEKLYVVDIFCHGVFSPKIWDEYIAFLENRFNEKITYFSFRDKEKGWRNKQLKVLTETKNLSDFCNYNASVLRVYEQNLSFRDVCYKCKYMNLSRVGDISIGDFWGIERVKPSLDKNTGVSAVLVNTKKGKEIIANIGNDINFTEFDQKDIMQQVLRKSTKKNPRRNEFIEDYKEYGMQKIFNKYGQVCGKQKLKRDFLVPMLYKLRLAGLASKFLHIKD